MQMVIVQSNFDLVGFMQMIVDILQDLIDVKGVVIEFVEGEWMVYCYVSGMIVLYVGLCLCCDGSFFGMCLGGMEVLCCDDVDVDVWVDKEVCCCVGVSLMICLFLFQNGVLIGVFKVMLDQVRGFDEDDVQILNLLVGVFGVVMGKQFVFDILQEVEMCMCVLLENVIDVMIFIDDVGCVLCWNVVVECMFGLVFEVVLGVVIQVLIDGFCFGFVRIFFDEVDGQNKLGVFVLLGIGLGELLCFVEFILM